MQIDVNDGRVRLLTTVMRGRLALLALLADRDGNLPNTYTVAATLGVRLPEVDKTMMALEAVGLVSRDSMQLTIPAYAKPVKERVKAHRRRRRTEDVTLCNENVTDVTRGNENVTQRYTTLHDVTPDTDGESARKVPPDPPKEENQSQSQSQKPPQPPTGAEAGAESDGGLKPYPKTAEALSRYPTEPTQAQMLKITAAAKKRGDEVAAALIDATAERVRADPTIYAPSGFLVKELETRKEVPVITRTVASGILVGATNEAAWVAAWRPKVEPWVRKHGKPETEAQREAMWDEIEVDWKRYIEWQGGQTN